MIERILTEELEKLRKEIIDAHDAAGQRASGKTAKSLNVEVNGTHGELLGASYIGVLDKGRKPGRVPFNMQEIILKWAQAKGLHFATPAQARSFAYFVSKRIREEGTELYRKGGRTDILQDPVERFTERLSKRIAGMYIQEVNNHIFEK